MAKIHAKSHRHVNFITHDCTVHRLCVFSVFNNRITLYFLGLPCRFCAKFIGLDLDIYLDFTEFGKSGKFNIHCNEEYEESKSIFLPRSQTSPSQPLMSEQPLLSSKGRGQQEIYSSTKWINTTTSTAAGELMSKSTKTTITNTQGILCTKEKNTSRDQSVSGSAKVGYSPCTQGEKDGHSIEQRAESSEKICKVSSILIHLHVPCKYKVINIRFISFLTYNMYLLLPQLGLQLQDSSTFTESQKKTETGEVVTTGQLNFNPQEQLQQQEQKAKPDKLLEPCEVRIFSFIILVFTTALFATVHTQLDTVPTIFRMNRTQGGNWMQRKKDICRRNKATAKKRW